MRARHRLALPGLPPLRLRRPSLLHLRRPVRLRFALPGLPYLRRPSLLHLRRPVRLRFALPGLPYLRRPSLLRSLLLPLLLLLLLLLLPSPAAAAPRPIALADYRAMLQAGVAHLERADGLIKAGKGQEAVPEIARARALLAGTWRVESPHGPADADLTGLEALLRQAGPGSKAATDSLAEALAVAREHLAAAEALERAAPADVPGARESLARALEATRARGIIQRVQDWINDLLGRRVGRAVKQVSVPPAVMYAGGGIALIALAWLGFGLYRNLAGHGAGGSAALAQGRERRPERPPTPEELRAQARALSHQGYHLEALRTAHLALLQHFDHLKLIRYLPSQTNREHERQLCRRFPSLARTLRTLNDLVDERLYSGHGATAEDFLRVDGLIEQLWREGDAASKGAEATPGLSSSASSG